VKQASPLAFFSRLLWLDNKPLVIEPYRRENFRRALHTFDDDGRPRYNLVLEGRAKKNFKTTDEVLAALYRLLIWKSPGGNQCYLIANDEDQSADDLELAKKLIGKNPILRNAVKVKQKIIERRDGEGFLEILPAGDVVGSHGKTYCFCGFDEIHGYKTWDILEAMQLDPTRPDALMWITSYASIFHRVGVPLFDLFATGKKGEDPRMFFSWYSADYCTDPALENASPEDRANPSRASWQDKNYLEQQRSRLPSHKYRRLHLNLPGSPEGAAFNAERIIDSIARGVHVRLPQPDISYVAFVDMSGGSADDATLAIAHREGNNRAVLDCVIDQGQRPPFDPRKAVARFATVLRSYRCFHVVGDQYAGNTFVADFARNGISYTASELSKSELYEAAEPRINAGEVVLLDQPDLESQFLGLVWRNNKIDHLSGEHDDWPNAAAGAIHQLLSGVIDVSGIRLLGPALLTHRGGPWTGSDDGFDHPMDRLLAGSRRQFWD
jgi:hypothetical protein